VQWHGELCATPRVERREWHFNLVKVREQWLIGAVDAR
jgi:hypothetical protein